MIQAKCIEKFRNKSGIIESYRLIDLNGVTQDVLAENLKTAIANKTVNVVNLTLTKNGRLVDCKEPQLQSKALGQAPVSKKQDISAKINEKSEIVGKALYEVYEDLITRPDSLQDIVGPVAMDVEYPIDVWSLSESDFDELRENNSKFSDCWNSDDVLDKILVECCILMITKPVVLKKYLEMFFVDTSYDFHDTLQEDLEDYGKDSDLYKAVCILIKYAKEKKLGSQLIQTMQTFIN